MEMFFRICAGILGFQLFVIIFLILSAGIISLFIEICSYIKRNCVETYKAYKKSYEAYKKKKEEDKSVSLVIGGVRVKVENIHQALEVLEYLKSLMNIVDEDENSYYTEI